MACYIMMMTWRMKCCFAVKISNYASIRKVPYLLLCSKFVFQFCVAMLHWTTSCLWPFVWSASCCGNQECDKPVFPKVMCSFTFWDQYGYCATLASFPGECVGDGNHDPVSCAGLLCS